MQGNLVVAIKLQGVKPHVTRRVRVAPDLQLNRFHQLIQAVMGWANLGGHLWYGVDDDFGDTRDFVAPGPTDERQATLTDLFEEVGDTAVYLYDFEANWTHELLLESSGAVGPSPRLLAGTGGCPPDGIPGPYFYEQFKLALKDRSHPFWRINRDLLSSYRGFNPRNFSLLEAADRLEQVASHWQRKKRRKGGVKSRAVVAIDNEPIRQRYRMDLDRASAELHKLEADLERFRGEDSSAFKTWLYATFPVRLSRIRELNEEIGKLSNRLLLMQAFQQHGVKSPGAAYGRAVRVENGADPMPDFPPRCTAEPPGRLAEEREFFRQAIRDLGTELGVEFADDNEIDSISDQLDDEEHKPDRNDCRSIYRQIALRLHPDRNGTMTQSEAEIWYRAQEAYAIRDILTLRQLWSRLSDDDVGGMPLSCGDMIERLIEIGAQITALTALRDSFKREAAWNFSRLTRKQLRSRQSRVEKDLSKEEEAVREELESLQTECQRLSSLQQKWESKHIGKAEQINLF